jgi:GNAT superfamily N-acetyltransferase
MVRTRLGCRYRFRLVHRRFFFVRPEIKVEIFRADRHIWSMFKDHHYLTGELSNASRCFVAVWEGQIVGFLASMTMPNGYIKNSWRGHRVVILPDYQGLGIGVRFIDAVAQLHIDDGLRFYSRSAHPRMGYYMHHSPLWKPTSKNRKLRTDVTHENLFNNHYVDNKRVCFSYEYVGLTNDL